MERIKKENEKELALLKKKMNEAVLECGEYKSQFGKAIELLEKLSKYKKKS